MKHTYETHTAHIQHTQHTEEPHYHLLQGLLLAAVLLLLEEGHPGPLGGQRVATPLLGRAKGKTVGELSSTARIGRYNEGNSGAQIRNYGGPVRPVQIDITNNSSENL